jgi:hypothetical protein
MRSCLREGERIAWLVGLRGQPEVVAFESTSLVGEPERLHPQIPTICAPITGQFSDVCTQPRSSIVRVRVYGYPSNALIEERERQDGACITPSPWRMDSNMTNADYEVEWRAVDGWGNWTTVRHWRGWFSPSTPMGSCSYGTSAHTLWDY